MRFGESCACDASFSAEGDRDDMEVLRHELKEWRAQHACPKGERLMTSGGGSFGFGNDQLGAINPGRGTTAW